MMLVVRRAALLAVTFVFAAAPTFAQDCQDSGVSPVDNVTLKAVTVASGVSSPMVVTSPPGDTDRLFIAEQAGRIRIKKRGDAPGVTTLFLDIAGQVKSGGEQGLLGLAFPPDYATSGEFYVNYSAGAGTCGIFGGPCRQVISRFSVTADPDVADPLSEVVLLDFDEPETNHNGGQLTFGPDDFLYIWTGDGGGGGDQHGSVCGNGQELGTLLGKILRIDVLGIDSMGTAPDLGCWSGYNIGTGFTVPSDNPLADGPGGTCDENWAYGLRNPWRNSFDALTGDLYVADVGQNCWEEINYLPLSAGGGQNYGWRVMEGLHCYNGSSCNPAGDNCTDISVPDCNDPSLTDPVKEYANPAVGDSVIGGYVYRGCRMPNFHGTYFWGDNGSGTVQSFVIDGGVVTNEQNWDTELGRADDFLTSFGEDALGELYMADAGLGQILKIMPPFTDLQVSGGGAADPFLLNGSGNWSWEDLEFASMHPVDYYEVYRGVPNGTFDCIHSTCDTSWAAGDTDVPAPDQLFAYFVVAISPPSAGAERGSTGNPERALGASCPHPDPPECP